LRTVTEIGEVVPSVKAGVVAIGPTDFQGIIADEFEVCGLDVGGDGHRIKESATGPFFDAGGAGAGCPNVAKGDLKGGIIVPGEFENAAVLEGSDVAGRGSHEWIAEMDISWEEESVKSREIDVKQGANGGFARATPPRSL